MIGALVRGGDVSPKVTKSKCQRVAADGRLCLRLLSRIGLIGLLALAFLPCCSRVGAETTYATWIMIWHGRDQGWWKPGKPPLDLVDGQWRSLDWVDEKQVEAHLEGIKKAGVTVVVADLTNGWKWLDKRCQLIQSICAKKGLKFCVAENSTGDATKFEEHARDIWNNFAGPSAPNYETYLDYHGKPLIICYAIRDWFKAYTASSTNYRNHFNLLWSSGEDSNADKWGWQLEPWVGSIPSKDSMFVTSAVKWNSKDPAVWRKSLAWMDYNFALARKNKPEFVIVGSYDDPTERNGWLVSDTSGCVPGLQTRDKTGALSKTAYYERVKQWIDGEPEYTPGGLIKDGAYKIATKAGDSFLGIVAPKPEDRGAAGATLGATKQAKDPTGLFWFYHLGKNHYRVIVLGSGLAVESSGGKLVQNWDSEEKSQRWTLKRVKAGTYTLTNDATGQALSVDGTSNQVAIQPVLTL